MAANDSSAALESVPSSQLKLVYFASLSPIGYTNLVALGGAINVACVPITTTACLLDNNLSNNGPGGLGKSGYNFAATPIAATATTPAQFWTTATPLGTTSGTKAYCAVDDGVVSHSCCRHYHSGCLIRSLPGSDSSFPTNLAVAPGQEYQGQRRQLRCPFVFARFATFLSSTATVANCQNTPQILACCSARKATR